jgi:hypothetical protein
VSGTTPPGGFYLALDDGDADGPLQRHLPNYTIDALTFEDEEHGLEGVKSGTCILLDEF